MGIGDKVSVLYKGKNTFGIVNHEFIELGKIVYMPLTEEHKLFPRYQITEWDKVDWITKVKILNESGRIDFNAKE